MTPSASPPPTRPGASPSPTPRPSAWSRRSSPIGRSLPVLIADHVRLVLEPTRRVTGRIDLAGIPPARVTMIGVPADGVTDRFAIAAPIAPDGAFSLGGAGVGRIHLSALVHTGWANELFELATLPASLAPTTDLQLAIPSARRELDIIVRSAVDAPLDGASVVLLAARYPPGRLKTVGDLDRTRLQGPGTQSRYAVPVVGENAPKDLLGELQRGDLIGHFEHVRAGALTVCAYTIGGDLVTAKPWMRRRDHADQLAVNCAPVEPDARVAILAVPPQPRLDEHQTAR